MNLNEVKKANLIEYARQRYGIKCNDKGMASCPFHPPDKNPSFSIYQGKGGSWRFKCFHEDKAGSIVDLKMQLEGLSKKEACSQLLKEFSGPAIKEFSGSIKKAETKKQALGSKKGDTPKKEKKIRHKMEYKYQDEQGNPVYRKVKVIFWTGDKKFYFEHPEGKGWHWGKGKAPFIPYNLDKFKGHEEVIICEGEKDANTISQLKIGFLTTSAPTGKGAWPETLTPYFKDFKKISFIYDVGATKDARSHAEKLQKVYPEMQIYIVKIPMEKDGNDITDYLAIQKDRPMALLDLLNKSKKFIVQKPQEDRAHIIIVDEVELKPIRWLWHHVFPADKVSLLVGDGGAGKSYFANYLASRITTGRDWIDPEGKQPIGKVVIITTEDGVADTIKARAALMETDQKKLIIIDGISEGISKDVRSLTICDNLALVEKAIIETGDVRLLVFDPITEFLGSIDDHRAGPTRSALAPLTTLAEKYRLSILIISHLNKDDAKKLIYRTTGSQSYVNMARAVWAIAEDDEAEDRRFLIPVKQNLSKKPPALAFSITDDKGIIFEKDPVKILADEAFGTEDQKFERSQVDEAKEFLLETLSNGSVRANDILKDARQAGIAEKTLRRAKSALNIISYKTFENDATFWAWKQKK